MEPDHRRHRRPSRETSMDHRSPANSVAPVSTMTNTNAASSSSEHRNGNGHGHGHVRTKSGSRPPSTPQASRTPTARSRRASASAGASMTAKSNEFIDDVRHEVMVTFLYQQQCSRLWVGSTETEGCFVRKGRGQYEAFPPALVDSPLGHAIRALNVGCAMTVNSRVFNSYLEWAPQATEIPMVGGQRIQMIPSMADIGLARKAQCAAFTSEEGLLIVWDDDALKLIERASRIERDFMNLVWKSATGDDHDERKLRQPADKNGMKRIKEGPAIDPETGRLTVPKRRVHILNSFLISLTLCVVTCSIGAALRHITNAIVVEGFWPQVSLAALVPIQFVFTLFFAQVVFGSIAQMFGPIRQLKGISKYYSRMLPVRLEGTNLPHVTIQCPVYKEGLKGVILPTVRSLKAAMTTYELQGGSCNLFVNDDGLQLLNEEDAQARIEFYTDNNIGYVARPPHSHDGFQRRGKFKKASNMNYALMISNNVEQKLASITRGSSWDEHDETQAYAAALQHIIEETGGAAWADGNIRMGDYVLLVDSDTRIPQDCLLDAVSEMEHSPEVAILQFSSGVLQVVHHYFENGISFFTDLIYHAIRYVVANGDVAPFVGHNAVVRWTALQSVSYVDADGYEKFWSESHVSEDFDMALRLQGKGYILRLATWAGNGFKEGVSLTVYDELARWEKYAYGCNELVFNPVWQWLYRGPLTPVFRGFLSSGIPPSTKITIISYIGTYYAIAAAWILTTVNYFLRGEWPGILDRSYLDSWQVWFSIIIVFQGLGNISLAALKYRINERSFFSAYFENLKWTPMLAIYLGGLSMHLSAAILAHMFGLDMQWGATAKEYEASNFWQEMPKIFKKFKVSMVFCWSFVALMIIMACAPFIPWGWEITDFVAILPMSSVVASHILLPLLLNPELMKLQF